MINDHLIEGDKVTSMRIVAGSHRGRRIHSPPGISIRPTPDRVRESIFNTLCHGNNRIGRKDRVEGAIVLDGFCGTGAMALEGLSRGAEFATCIDINSRALEFCRRNAEALNFLNKMEFLSGNCLYPDKAKKTYSLIFLDPPYYQDLVAPALSAFKSKGWITTGTICTVETGSEEKPKWPPYTEIIEQRKFGKTLITFLIIC